MTVTDIIFSVLLLLAVISYAFRTRQRYGRIILIYLLLLLLLSIASICILVYTPIKNNLFIFHIFTPVQYLILSLLYSYEISTVPIRRIIQASIPVFIVICILLSLFVQKMTDNDSIATIIGSIGLILWPLLFLRQTLKLQEVNSLLRFPMFWISVGFLFYFIGSLATEGMLDYLISHDMEMAQKVFFLTYIFKYMLFIMLFIGAWCEMIFSNEKQ
jgi:hypothetical protein